MGKCEFYNLERLNFLINEAGSRSTTSKTCKYAWCAHANSPVIKEVAKNTVGGELLLTCDGNIDKCLLPQADIDIMKSKYF